MEQATPPPPAAPPPPPPPGSPGEPGAPTGPDRPKAPGLAVAGFVCGLVGLVLSAVIICWFIGLPTAIVGVILSVIGRRQAVERGAPTGLATAGFVCGVIGTVIGLAITVLVIADGDSDLTFELGAVLPLPLLFCRDRMAVALRGAASGS